MCGRAKLEGDISEIKIAFRVPPEYPTPNFAPSWNVAPTDSLPIVRYNLKAGHRTLDLMRWGLIPYWAKDAVVGEAAGPAAPQKGTPRRSARKHRYNVGGASLRPDL
jgi:putative SOS response-associated peptidase YedK